MSDKISLSSFSKQYGLSKSTVHRRCGVLNIPTSDGLDQSAIERLLQDLGLDEQNPKSEPIVDELATPDPMQEVPTPVNPIAVYNPTVEAGNHAMMLATPTLPSTFNLEVLRKSEAVSFEDPLAIANQFLVAADQLTNAMQQDIEIREQRLNQTKQAKEQITTKAQELRLEQRLYQERVKQVDRAVTQETNALQGALSQLQQLGKQED